MYIIGESEKERIMGFLYEAERVARRATCLRAKGGSIIVGPRGEVLGRGFNSPPAGLEGQRRCNNMKGDYDSKVTDKTCCVHAEERAIIEAVGKNEEKVKGSRLYYVRLNQEGKIINAGRPYCTICSKLALDVGIKEFVLWHEEGITIYDTEEYNDISYKFNSKEMNKIN